MDPKPGYVVIAYERGAPVCEVATAGEPLTVLEAPHFARELRREFPGAVVATLPAGSYVP
ncbi:hypothetical protein AN218_18560 [Streptomyces nanshensis]|uniref:Uncharacterized protein n=1 Tax=Streptomyces nanshensis TaxID=518642 RepID=A0A1E7L239_9ACTN|nr:hypothetical protein AN218_18560 [Streptomyces nanshensis]